MTTEAVDRRRSARAREDAAVYVTEESIIQMEQTQYPPAAPEPPQNPQVQADGVSVKNEGYRTLYKKVAYGWKPTRVSVGAMAACLETGAFRLTCGDCGGHCGLDPNSCPSRSALPFRSCPVCDKHIFDTPEEANNQEETAPAPGEIRDDAYRHTTPEQRTKVKLDNHIVAFHPSYAQSLGIIAAQTGSIMPIASEMRLV